MLMHSMRSFCATIEYSSRRFPFRYLSVSSFGRQTQRATCMRKEPWKDVCIPRLKKIFLFRRIFLILIFNIRRYKKTFSGYKKIYVGSTRLPVPVVVRPAHASPSCAPRTGALFSCFARRAICFRRVTISSRRIIGLLVQLHKLIGVILFLFTVKIL